MFKFNKHAGRLLLGAAAAVMAMAAGAFGASALTENTVVMREYEQEAAEGMMNVGIKGSYLGDIDKALSKINSARYEACKNGVPDPNDPSRKLTLNDFVPAQYSAELERIARIRAAEATLVYGHTRPNGESCFSIASSSTFRYHAESLAWNSYDSLLRGIDQFYKEKTDWEKQTPGAITGHYTQMINPNNRYVGIGCFNTKDTTGYPTALCVRYARSDENLSGAKGEAVENCVVPVQVPEDRFDGIRIRCVSGSKRISSGSNAEYELRGTVSYEFGSDSTWDSDVVLYDTDWKISDSSVAQLDGYGCVTALKPGTARITALSGDDGVIFKLTVTPTIEDCKVTIPYASYTYRGRAIKPTVTVKYGDETLVKDIDYTVSYSNNTNVGTASITVTGKGRFSGKTVKNFTVKALGLNSSYAVMSIPYSSYTYTGKAIKPALTLKFKDGSVIPTSEYMLSYASNIKVGTAKIYVIPKSGNLSSSGFKEFVVKPAKNEITSLSSGRNSFTLSWTKATEGASGYQVLYSKSQDFSEDVHSFSTRTLSSLSQRFTLLPRTGETWYVKVRSFVEINNTRYGNYSAVKKIKII
ncbi:MAG: Ig-like domain-containing protein [Ruminococcus sp.]|nr:Ig-like domain-containing protein [Ruminococcus sp.]